MEKLKPIKKEASLIDIPKGEVIVIGTEKSPYMKTGKEYPVSSELAKTLIKKGAATLK